MNAVLAIQFSCCRIKLRCLNSKLLSLNQISYTVPGFVPWTCSVYLLFNSYLNSINTMFHVPCLLFLHQESIGQKLLITSFFKSQPSTCFIIDSPPKSRSFSSYLPYIAFVKDSFFSLICFYCKLLFLSMSLLTDLYTTTWGTHLLPLLVFFWNCFLMWPSCRGYFFLSQRAQLMYCRY